MPTEPGHYATAGSVDQIKCGAGTAGLGTNPSPSPALALTLTLTRHGATWNELVQVPQLPRWHLPG